MFTRRATSLTLVIFLMAVMIGFCAEPARRTLSGHVPPVVAQLTPQGDLPLSNYLSLAIGLPLRNQPALAEFLRQLYDPRSPGFHKFLTPEEFTARFGPTAADYAAVQAFAQTSGFQITGTHGNRLLLDVRADVADIQRAFHISLRKFKHPREDRDFYAPDLEPTVAFALPIEDVSGLNNFQLPHPNLVRKNSSGIRPVAKSGSASTGDYLGDDFRAAYVPGTALTGAGQMVGLLQFDGFYARDVLAYARAAGGGRTNIPIQTVLLDGYDGTPHSSNGEVALDIAMAMAMAPGLEKIIVFSGGPNGSPNDILNAMAASNTVKNLSCSWGWSGGPNATTDAIFQQMAAQGQSFFNASADSGAFTIGANSVNGVDNSLQPNSPSSSPYITQVGGTVLTTTGPGGAWQSETAWHGSSGGISSYYSIPSWQAGVSMVANLGSTTKRNIPDVALTADNIFYYSDNGASGSVAGTSCSAPLWAGLTALANEQAVATGKPAVGFINPAIYTMGTGPDYSQGFYDITTGNNTSGASPSQFYAVNGYDLCTGWGTPTGQNLIEGLLGNVNSVAGSLGIASNPQITAAGPVGGPFSSTPSIITLTNSGDAPLTWRLLNPGAVAWLNVATTGGTLNPAATTNVLVNFTTGVAGLAVGNYSASFRFTDTNSTTVQIVTFQLTVQPLLSVQPDSGFNATGPVGGPFVSGTQGFTVMNLGKAAAAWKIKKPGSWLAVSPASGKVAANGQSRFTVSLTAKAKKMGVGNYTATVTVQDKKKNILKTLRFTLSVTAPAAAAPQMLAIVPAPAAFNFTFAVTPGALYQAQCKTNLAQPDWVDVGGPLLAETNSLKFTDADIGDCPQKFYRLQLVP